MNLSLLQTLNAKADAVLNQFAAIDLGYKYDDSYPSSYDPKKTQYPSLYISNAKGEAGDIPDDGKATIEFKVTSRTMNESDGKKRYSLSLDVLSFEPEAKVKADAKAKAAGKAVEMSTLFADNRTRNGDGQFVGGATGGADPVTMRQAYGDKPAPKNPLLAPGAAAAALAGAGLLGSKVGRVAVVKGAKSGARVVRAATAGLDRKVKGKTGAMWPRMGSKAPQRTKPGFGEVLMRNGKPEGRGKMPQAAKRF